MSRSRKYLNVNRLISVITSVIILGVMIYSGMDAKADGPNYLYMIVGNARINVMTQKSGDAYGYDAPTNTLTLKGYTYNGTGQAVQGLDDKTPVIYYRGDSELTINLVGSNTITLTGSDLINPCGIYVDNGGANITGTGSLTINLPGSGSYYSGIEVSGGNLTLNSGTITVSGGTYGIHASSVVVGGTINTTGCSYAGFSGGTIKIDGGTIKAEGAKYGILANSGAVTVNAGTVYAKGGEVGISGYTGNGVSGGEYINGGNCEFIGGSRVFGDTLYNTIAGTGWDNVEGIGTGVAIPVNAGYTSLLQYKRAVFPAVADEKASDGSSEGTPASEGTELQDASGNDSGFRVTNSDQSNPTVIYEGTKADKSKTTITIPDTVTDASGNVYKVTSIKSGAFKGNKKVKTVTVGNNVEVIGSQAFANCPKLTKVTLGSQVTKIESKAFSGDKKLKKITIKSKKLKTVQKKAFKSVPSSVTVKVPKKSKAKYTKLLKKGGLSVKATIK